MDQIKLKNNFHNLIDDFDNTETLQEFYKILKNYKNIDKSVDILDELTANQKERLNISIWQSKNSKTVNHDEIKSKLKNGL